MLYLLITLTVLVAINMPIGFAIGIAGAVYFLTSGAIPFPITIQRVVAQTQSIAFLAVPFFIFAGHLMNHTGITHRLLRFASLLTRGMHGGLAQMNVVLSTMMGGISGSAVADWILSAWDTEAASFRKVMPTDYQRVLDVIAESEAAGLDEAQTVDKIMEAARR